MAGEYYSGKERYAEQIARLGIRDKLVMMDCYIADREVAQLFQPSIWWCSPIVMRRRVV